jgi:hypothetical protein
MQNTRIELNIRRHVSILGNASSCFANRFQPECPAAAARNQRRNDYRIVARGDWNSASGRSWLGGQLYFDRAVHGIQGPSLCELHHHPWPYTNSPASAEHCGLVIGKWDGKCCHGATWQ